MEYFKWVYSKYMSGVDLHEIFYLICIKLYFGGQLNNNAVTKCKCVRVRSVRFQTRITYQL